MNTMEMPVPCQKCGEWFELHEGRGSRRWYPNTVICSDCGEEEQEEIERENEIRDLEEEISDMEYDIEELESAISSDDEVVTRLQKKIREDEETVQEYTRQIAVAKERLEELKKATLR